jgi:hypothetical protein
MSFWRRILPGSLLLLALSWAVACSGVDPNAKINSPPALDDGGGEADAPAVAEGGGASSSSGGPGSSSGIGGACGTVRCSVDNDCTTKCAPPMQQGYIWCCASNSCFTWSTVCPGEAPSPKDAGGAE